MLLVASAPDAALLLLLGLLLLLVVLPLLLLWLLPLVQLLQPHKGWGLPGRYCTL
jgi:hypothetical protein